MPADAPRLVLITPYGTDESQAAVVGKALDEACAAGDVAATILRLRQADERTLINLIKRLAPAAQRHGSAALVCVPDFPGDLVSVAMRGGADGVHVDGVDGNDLQGLRERLREGRILGCRPAVESKHEAMAVGEAQADYLMFGGLSPDGAASAPVLVRERAAWWAEIFETPCIAVASLAGEVADLAPTGAEFIGLEGALWLGNPGEVAAAQAAIAAGRRAR